MNNNTILFTSIMLTVFVTFGLFGSVRFLDDNDYITNTLVMHANIDNRGNDNVLENVRTKFVILDAPSYRATSSQNNIGSDDVKSRVAISDVYDLPPGEYWVKMYAYGNDGERDIKHRLITVQ